MKFFDIMEDNDMKHIYKMILAVILAVLVITATGIVMTGCGEEKKDAEPTAATTAETAKETTAAAGQQTDSAAQTTDDNGAQSADNGGSAADPDGYIDEATAIANVRSLVGSGAQIVSSEKGYTPEGWEAWIIVVAPVTKSDSPETVTYYSGYQFCYPAASEDTGSDSDTDDGYIDEATAIANVRWLEGSGAQIISSEKGHTPEGWAAWIIVVAPVTTSDGPETVTYYSGYQFCYRADSAE